MKATLFLLLAIGAFAAPNLAGTWNIGGRRIGYLNGVQQDFNSGATFTAVNTVIRQDDDMFWWDLSGVFPNVTIPEFPCIVFDRKGGDFEFKCASTLNTGNAFGSGSGNKPTLLDINFMNSGFGAGFLETPFATRGAAYKV